MRSWIRAAEEKICGGPCVRRITRGEPVFKITIGALYFYRCAHCAGEPVPADLPPLVERLPLPTRSKHGGRVMLPFDFKLAQVARDPGEEG